MRGTILTEALEIINGERQDQYGNPEDSFEVIADLWNSILGPSYVTPRDVCLLMALFKLGREVHQKKRDNLIDAVGYLALAADMPEKG